MSEDKTSSGFKPISFDFAALDERDEKYEYRAPQRGWYSVPCINDAGEVIGQRSVELEAGESVGISYAFKDGQLVFLGWPSCDEEGLNSE